MYPHGIIGNCQVSALVNLKGAIDWLCMPRPDSPPLFGSLIDPDGGQFQIGPSDGREGSQAYVKNTNVLQTTFVDDLGNQFAVYDFCPRFEQYGRNYRPATVVRIVRPIKGTPAIRVSCRMVRGWSKEPAVPSRGNSHFRYSDFEDEVRLTTNMPLTYLAGEKVFTLLQPLYFVLTWGLPVQDELESVCESFLNKTVAYWQNWIKHCHIPSSFQSEVIRSALTLKLHCYEETGAILAAITTSLPEEVGSTRNWDYRFCWLRDAYFTVSAFHKLGHFEELEGILNFLLNILGLADVKTLAPVYRIDASLPLPELSHDCWKGYQATTPVREGNQAAEHVQNDVYGEMLLTLSPIYFDDRFSTMRTHPFDNLLHTLAERCFESLEQPDAGIWEHRDGWKVHAFTLLMCWAGLERYERLISEGRLLGDAKKANSWKLAAESQLKRATRDGIIWNSTDPTDTSADASLLVLPILRYTDAAATTKTINEIMDKLRFKSTEGTKNDYAEAFFYRYRRTDDFGTPTHAFVICTFWMIQALALQGRKDEARSMLERSLVSANHVGLFAEHFDPDKMVQRGNFPQCYSHVGLIHSAFSVSQNWDEIL